MLLGRARCTVAVALDDDARADLDPQRVVSDAVAVLDEMLEGVTLQRGSRLRRAGRRRSRHRVVLVAAVASLLTVGTGTFAYESPKTVDALHLAGPSATPRPPRRSCRPATTCSTPTQVRRLAPKRSWQTVRTTNNTSGNGINSVVPAGPLRRPEGLRRAGADVPHAGQGTTVCGADRRGVAVDGRGRAHFDTTLGWFAGCRAPQVQVVGAYRVHGVGDEAALLVLRRWGKPHDHHVLRRRAHRLLGDIDGRDHTRRPLPHRVG